MSERPELVNTKKAGGSDLDHLRAVNSNSKIILTACLSVCMCEYVRASKSVRGFLSAFLSPGGCSLFFIILSKCPHSLGSVIVYVCLSICLSVLTSHILVCHNPSFFFAKNMSCFEKQF